MSESELLLRDNLLDALDRLYDQECRVIDVRDLIDATRVGLSSTDLVEPLTDAVEALALLVRLGRPEAEANRAALVVTDPIRLLLAAGPQTQQPRPRDLARGRAVAVGLLRDAAAARREFGDADGAAFFEAVAAELSS